jgi:Domain of unknown function (DUF4124)
MYPIVAVVFLTVLVFAPTANAQIYTCTAEDGTRVFSDERCGPDAKVVPGIGTFKKRSNATKPAANTAKPVPKSEAELQALSVRCDAGDTQACNEWTRSGGPAALRGQEGKLEQACEGGSLPACEERYCRDGATKECRARVRQTAQASGTHWYLRAMGTRETDGSTRYEVRCLREADLATHDIALTCGGTAGPHRCRASDAAQGFATMSEAASRVCTAR